MNEIEAMRWQLDRYRAVLTQQVDRVYNALAELQRTTLLLLGLGMDTENNIDAWLESEGFAVDEDGFYQSLPLLSAFREGAAPADCVSFSWGRQLRTDPTARHHLFCHRQIGPHLKHIHDRLGDVGWIYYQDAGNTSLQYPYIDQRTAIPSDFDWSSYHTYLSVCPENNPERQIRWTLPTIDYAGEGVILSVSIPVWRGESFLGLWSIDLPVRYLYRDFASSQSFPDQTQFIVNGEGLLVLHEKLQAEIDQTRGKVILHPLTDLGPQWAQLDLEETLSREEGELTITDELGEQWQFCHCHVSGVDWTLFSGLPRTSMEEAAAQRLSLAFRQIADGDFSHRIDSSSIHALPTLIEEFNRMSLRLGEAESRRKEMENQLRQAQKMEAVGRLAGGVAHDYNNMTTVIMGYAELILEQLDENDDLYADVLEIINAASRSRDLTRQLLAFARRQPVSPRILDLNEAVSGMVKMLKHLIGEDIELLWCPGEQIWPVQIDPSQIDQILANLCVNARDAITGVGKIIIETANVILDEEYCSQHPGFVAGEFAQLTVSDDGAGMTNAIKEKIFEPFFSTKAIGQGTGLGLATIYGIVKQNNGFINVYSEPGNGSAFTIYLPRTSSASAGQVSQSEPGSLLVYANTETLLVVEDNIDILHLVERMLKKIGYQVLAASSPVEAVELARHHPEKIDLLITDVIMPDLSGRELAARLRLHRPTLKVLYMSGYTANVISNRGILEKHVVLLQKPFSQQELTIKVREVLNSASI